ncbi:MAG: hypothetical protein DMG76_17375 [Acidobacteria bacterium]|jgi:hypothetical protein|nr:MAG: hypothetical protein DMG76_17375 [Acidobacteriota bacterium]
MGNIVPNSAPQILELTLDKVRLRANANGECFGGEIMDAMREAAAGLRVDRLEVLLTRTVLVQTMESLGENYPAEVLQDYENPMQVSKALRYLNEAINWTARLKASEQRIRDGENDTAVCSTAEKSTN